MSEQKEYDEIMSDEGPNCDEIDQLEIERPIAYDLGCGSPQDARYKLDMITRKFASVTAELDELRKSVKTKNAVINELEGELGDAYAALRGEVQP